MKKLPKMIFMLALTMGLMLNSAIFVSATEIESEEVAIVAFADGNCANPFYDCGNCHTEEVVYYTYYYDSNGYLVVDVTYTYIDICD